MNLIFRTLIAAVAVALASLAFGAGPASASNGSQGASLSQVRSELREASAALDQIWGDDSDDFGDDDPADDADDPFGDDPVDDPTDDPADDPDDDFADVNLDAVASNLDHTATARQLAQKVKPRKNRAVALTAVAQQADDNVFEYADDIGWVDPDEQPTFVDALDQSLDARSALIGSLVSQAPKQAASARAKTLKAISDALSDGDPEVLLDTLAEEDGYGATYDVKQTVVAPLASMLNDSRDVAGDIRDLGASLPASERRDPRDAVDAIDAELDGLPDYVDELFGDMEDYDDPAGGASAFCGYVAQLPLPTPDACG
jgi:hypothetical protein